MNNIVLYFLLLFLTFFCFNNNASGQTEEVESTLLNFVSKSLKKESSTCATDDIKCASVFIQYVLAENAPAEVLKKINHTLKYHFVNSVISLGEKDFTKEIDMTKVGDNFIADYELFLKEVEEEDFITHWEIERYSNVEYVSNKTACIMYGTSFFTGGAHSNYIANILNFDVKTGEKLDIKDYIKDKTALEKIAKQAFRVEREIDVTQSLEDVGFFRDEIFRLPENMGLVEDGLKLYYNTYEVAPFSHGPTEFVIPYDQLEGIIK